MSVIHHHQYGDPCTPQCIETPERRLDERRKPLIDMPYREGKAFIFEKKYTGPLTVHVSEGVPKRIVLPNPEGW